MSFQIPQPSPASQENPFVGMSDPRSSGKPPISYTLWHVNWLAHVFQKANFKPDPLEHREFIDTLKQYLTSLLFSDSAVVSQLARAALSDVDVYMDNLEEISARLRDRFSTLPWRALLIPGGTVVLPSGMALERLLEFEDPRAMLAYAELSRTERQHLSIHHEPADDYLKSGAVVKYIASMRQVYPGLVFQLGSNVKFISYLQYVFFALKRAFANANKWPGVIVWNLKGDCSFFPSPHDRNVAEEATNWIFSTIAQEPSANLDALTQRYLEQFTTSSNGPKTLNIIHTSDTHLGNKTSDSRLNTVKDRIIDLVKECDLNSQIVPVVTGDLMDTPAKRNLDSLYDYLNFLDRLGTARPVIVLGNHDVRKWGVLSKSYQEALRLYLRPIVLMEDSKVALLCFNSVRGGNLARGIIDEQEFATLGHELDVEGSRISDYALLALVHHHPVPIARPDWYEALWYERLFGKWFETTEEMVNAPVFLEWLYQRNVVAVLHGHKHIPRVTQEGMPIIGCGSTIGKVPSQAEGRTFMSYNTISVDVGANRISCRLRAERIIGAGLSELESHEILYRGGFSLAA